MITGMGMGFQTGSGMGINFEMIGSENGAGIT